MSRVVHDLDVKYGRQAAQTLSADAQRVDLLVKFQTQFFNAGQCGTAGCFVLQFADITGRHQRFFGHQHGFFWRTTNADAENARRAPTRTHGRDGLQHPVDDGVRRVEGIELGLVFRTTAFGSTDNFQFVAFDDFVMDNRRCVVFRVFTGTRWIQQDRSAQFVVWVQVGTADAFVDHFLNAEGGIPFEVLTDFEENNGNAGILADRAVAFGGHPRVGQNLGNGVLGGRAFFALISFA